MTESDLGFYMTLVSIGQAISFPIAGRTIPRMNIPVHMTIICAIEAVAAIAMSTYGSVHMWYVSGLVIGFCMGFNTSIGVAIVLTNWFAKKTGFAIGMAWAIGSLANAITTTTITNQLFTSYSESVGYGAAFGSLMVTVAMLSDIAWNPLIGFTCDKFGADKGVILWCAVTILSFVCLGIGASMPAFAFVGASLNDTMYACYGTGIAMLTAFLFGSKDYAKIYSLVPAIGYALGCMGVPILTSIYQATGGYNSVWLFCAACDAVIALCVILAARNSKKLPQSE